MTFLVQQTLIYAVPLMIVALAGVFAERSGIINLALEGIMIFGAFIGVLFVRLMQGSAAVLAAQQTGNWVAMQGLELLAMLVAAAMGAVFSLLLSFASINLRADQTIGGTALNLMAPALVLFLVRIIANQNTLQLATGDSATWFMIRKSTFGIDKNTDLGFFGETFLVKVYLATYVCIILFVILSIILYKTRFGLRLRACGENPQAADSLGINVYKMRYIGTTISGALAGMGGFVYALTTANCSSNGDVAGFGFLALAVMIFGNWRPLNIAGASLLFGLFKCIAAAYSSIDINGDGVYWLAEIGISYVLCRVQESGQHRRLHLPRTAPLVQQHLQHDALRGIHGHSGLHLQEVPCPQGGGHPLRQGPQIRAAAACIFRRRQPVKNGTRPMRVPFFVRHRGKQQPFTAPSGLWEQPMPLIEPPALPLPADSPSCGVHSPPAPPPSDSGRTRRPSPSVPPPARNPPVCRRAAGCRR